MRLLPVLILAASLAACSGYLSTAIKPESIYARAGSESVLHSFGGAMDGAGPPYGVIAGKSGVLYGATIFGGESKSSSGTVFELTPNGTGYTERVIYSFRGGLDGRRGVSGVAQDALGTLYGDTFGGSDRCLGGCGTVYKLTPSGGGFKKSTIYLFNPPPDASQPVGTPVLDANGDVFGVTQQGGTANQGAVFELTPTRSGYAESVLYSFPGGTGGSLPQSGLTFDAHGALYGTTQNGGNLSACAGGCGTVFKLTPRPSGGYSESIIYAFGGGFTDGFLPFGTLSVDNATGNVYGTTWYGDHSTGTVFKLTPSGSGYSERIIHAFRAGTSLPSGQILIAPGGSLYGTTRSNGSDPKCSCGVVFELTPAGSQYIYRVVYAFKQPIEGDDPGWTTLIMDTAGSLIGTTLSGGSYLKQCNDGLAGCGVVFRISGLQF